MLYTVVDRNAKYASKNSCNIEMGWLVVYFFKVAQDKKSWIMKKMFEVLRFIQTS